MIFKTFWTFITMSLVDAVPSGQKGMGGGVGAMDK